MFEAWSLVHKMAGKTEGSKPETTHFDIAEAWGLIEKLFPLLVGTIFFSFVHILSISLESLEEDEPLSNLSRGVVLLHNCDNNYLEKLDRIIIVSGTYCTPLEVSL